MVIMLSNTYALLYQNETFLTSALFYYEHLQNKHHISNNRDYSKMTKKNSYFCCEGCFYSKN